MTLQTNIKLCLFQEEFPVKKRFFDGNCPQFKDLHSKEMYSTWFGDDVIRFAPAVGGQIGVTTSM